jgi:hypothetical protein
VTGRCSGGWDAGGPAYERIEGAVGQQAVQDDHGSGAIAGGVPGLGAPGGDGFGDGRADEFGRGGAPAGGLGGERVGYGVALGGVGAAAGDGPDLLGGDAAPFGADAAGVDDDDVDAERATSMRRQSLMASRANLVAWYQAPSGVVILPPMEVTLTIVPECWARIAGRTSWMRRAAPKTLTSIWARASAMGT